jgi:hypothetical protein
MARDKKAREAGLTWVLPAAPGSGVAVSDLDPAAVREELDRFVAGLPAR